MNRPSPFDHPETVPAGRALALDPQGRGAAVDGRHVGLTASEFGILRTMAQHPGHAFERDELQHHVESLRDAGERTIDSHVKNLRKKLGGGNRDSDFIKTVHGYGYRFENGEVGHWPQPSTSRSFCIGSAVLTMDYDGHRVFIGAAEVDLTGSEWDVLEYLALFPGENLDSERISREALGVGFAESGRLLATHIKNLRKKLKIGEYQPKWIGTVHGVGYRFDGEPVQLDGTPEQLDDPN